MSSIKLSAADTKLLTLAWQCFETVPKVNVKTLASLGNYKTPASANSCWYLLKNKLGVKNAGAALNLTPADHKLLELVWQCFDSVPKVDVKKLAEMGGYKTAASANSCWYGLRKKLFPAGDGGAAASPKRSPRKRKGGDLGSSPVVKKRCAGTTREVTGNEEGAVKVEDGVEGESEGELEAGRPKRNIWTSLGTPKLQGAESKQDGSATIKAEGEEGGSASSAEPEQRGMTIGSEVKQGVNVKVEPEQRGTATGSEVTREVKVKVEDEEVPDGFFEQMLQFTGKD